MTSMTTSESQIVFVRPLVGDEIAVPQARQPTSRFGNATEETVVAGGEDAINELFARAYGGDVEAAESLIYIALQAATHVERLAEEKRDILAKVAPKWPVWPLRAAPLKANLDNALAKMVSLHVGAESDVYLCPQISFENPLTRIAGVLNETLNVNAFLMKEQRNQPLSSGLLRDYEQRFSGRLCRKGRSKMPAWLQRLSEMSADASARDLWSIAWAVFIETYPDFLGLTALAIVAPHLREAPTERRAEIRKGLKQAFLSLSNERKRSKSRG